MADVIRKMCKVAGLTRLEELVFVSESMKASGHAKQVDVAKEYPEYASTIKEQGISTIGARAWQKLLNCETSDPDLLEFQKAMQATLEQRRGLFNGQYRLRGSNEVPL